MLTRKPHTDDINRGAIAWIALGLMLWLQVAVAAHQHVHEDNLRIHQCLTCVQLHGAGQALSYTADWPAPDLSFDYSLSTTAIARLGNRPLTRRARAPPFSLL
jgi:hypothetical protein